MVLRDAGGRQSTDGKLALEYVVSFELLSVFSNQYCRHRAEAEVVLRDVGGQSVLTAGGWGASLKAATRMALHVMFRLMRECSPPNHPSPWTVSRRASSVDDRHAAAAAIRP